jgi:hypoxia up-regulated 1
VGQADQIQPIQVLYHEKAQVKVANNTFFFVYDEEKDLSFSLEQLQGMIFKRIRTFAKKMVSVEPQEGYLVVPAHWSLDTRAAFANAASLGGLKVLGITTENTAAATHYALSRNDTEPVKLLFVNLGHADLHLSLVEFEGVKEKNNKTSESVRVLHEKVIRGVGSYHFDLIVLEFIYKEYQKKYGESIRDNFRATRKALITCEKVKESLSASKEVPIYIEGLTSGVDFSASIKRADYEEAAAPVLAKIRTGIEGFLKAAGVEKEQVQAVELIGGGVRVPCVITAVNDTMAPVEVGTHINGDESMSLGAVFMAANASSIYRVKKVYVQEGFPFELGVYIKANGLKVYSGDLFSKRDYFGKSQEFSFDAHKLEDSLEVQITKDGDVLKTYFLNNLTALKKEKAFENGTGKMVLNFTLRLDSVGVVELVRPTLIQSVNKSTEHSEVKYEFVEEPIPKNESAPDS